MSHLSYCKSRYLFIASIKAQKPLNHYNFLDTYHYYRGSMYNFIQI